MDVRRAAAGGAWAGLAWAVSESAFCSIAPRLLQPAYAYTPVHPGLTTMLFVLYPACGALFGVLARAAGAPARAALVASLGFLALFAGNLAHLTLFSRFSFDASTAHLALPLGLALVLIAANAFHLAFPDRALSVRPLTGPWAASALLSGLPWLTVRALESAGRTEKILAVALFPLGTAAVALLAERAFRGRGGARALTGGAAAALVLATSLALDDAPRVVSEPPPVPREGSERPGVVLLVLDTVRADHLSLYGYERATSPELEELAREAVTYRRSVASGDMTLTTHASIFTGLYGRAHGAHRDRATPAGRPLPAAFRTLAEHLAQAGYWCAAVVANRGYVTEHFGLDQGFHHFDSRAPVPFLGQVPPYSLRRAARAALVPFVPRHTFDRVLLSADAINDEAFELLDRAADRHGPFFLFVNYMDAHNPFLPPPPFDTMFPGKDPSFTSNRYGRLMWQMNRRGVAALGASDSAHIVSQYDGAIAYLDSRVGRLVDRLRDLGRYENTLLIVTSDHGEALGERGLLNHGISVSADQVFVPLVMKYPRSEAARTVDTWTSSVDVLPTVLDVVGLPAPAGLSGTSLAQADPSPERAVVAESYSSLPEERFGWSARAIHRERWKLMRGPNGGVELYDVDADPGESTDLAGGAAAAAGELSQLLDGWLEATRAGADTAAAGALDADSRDRLRALGYLD